MKTPRTLIGGIGYRWMRDASFGVLASDLLSRLTWPEGVEVADLGYGALLVADDLLHAEPRYTKLILLASVVRGREAGKLYPRRWLPAGTTPDEVQTRIREAGAGVVDVDHLLIIAQQFGALPDDVIVIELEPFDTEGGEEPSEAGMRSIAEAVDLVRRTALGERPAVEASC